MKLDVDMALEQDVECKQIKKLSKGERKAQYIYPFSHPSDSYLRSLHALKDFFHYIETRLQILRVFLNYS